MANEIDITVKVTGFEDVQRVFAELPKEIAQKALRSSLLAGAAIIQRQAQAMAPKAAGGSRYWATGGHAPGRLKKSIVARVRPTPRFGDMQVSVGALKSAYYWHFIEFGHRIVRDTKRYGRGGGKRVLGTVAARPFLRPAFDQAAQQAVQKVFQALGPRIIGIARSLRRRVAKLG